MGLFPEQPLVGPLAGDAGQIRGNGGQHLNGGHAVIDVGAVAVVCGDDPAHQKAVFGLIAVLGHDFGCDGAWGHVEKRGQFRAFAAVPNHLGTGAKSKQQIDGADDNRFAGTGFTAQNGQPIRKADLQVVNDGEIFYCQFLEHATLHAGTETASPVTAPS